MAAADLDGVVAGQPAPQRADIDGYWLIPAVRALRPDGSLDDASAADATSRDEVSTSRFLLAARAALGRGPELLDELVAVLGPDQSGEPLAWDPVQVMFWAATLRGVFGPDALERLEPVAGAALDQVTEAEWQDWARAQSTDTPTGSGFRGPRAAELRTTTWLADQLAAVIEPVQAGTDDDSWQLSWRTADQSDSAERAATIASQTDPAAVERSNRELLLGIAQYLIAQGAPGEHELLTRVAELRAEIADPSGLGSQPTPSSEVTLPATTTRVADQLRQTALDPNASTHDRRLLWRWISVQLRDWLVAEADAQAPQQALVPVGGHRSLQVGADGPTSEVAVEAERARLAEVYAASPLAQRWLPILGGGLLLVVGATVLAVLNVSGWGAALLLVGLVLSALGGNYRGKARRALDSLQQARANLDESLTLAQRRAERENYEEAAFFETRTQTARRALSMIPEPNVD